MGTPNTSPFGHPQSTSPSHHYQQQVHHNNNNNNNNNPQQYKYGGVSGPAPGSALYPPMSRLMYTSPLTPPSSEPGSPGGTLPRRTPPPPYPNPGCQQTTVSTGHRLSNAMKYNRRNNPELEKRRIHHCDFIGKYRNPYRRDRNSRVLSAPFLLFCLTMVLLLCTFHKMSDSYAWCVLAHSIKLGKPRKEYEYDNLE